MRVVKCFRLEGMAWGGLVRSSSKALSPCLPALSHWPEALEQLTAAREAELVALWGKRRVWGPGSLGARGAHQRGGGKEAEFANSRDNSACGEGGWLGGAE